MSQKATRESEDARRLYIGNLQFETNESELRDAIVTSAHVVVEGVKLICDYKTGRNKGFGFVTLQSSADVDKVLVYCEEFDIILRGRRLRVQRANARSPAMSGFRRDLRKAS